MSPSDDTLRSSLPRDAVSLPSRRWAALALGMVLLVLLVASVTRLSIPTTRLVRIVPLPFQPAEPPFTPIALPLRDEPPVRLRLLAGGDVVRRIDLYTDVVGGGRPPGMLVRVRDHADGSTLARARVAGRLLADRKMTAVRLPDHAPADVVDIEISTDRGGAGFARVELQAGPPGSVPGLELVGAAATEGAGGVSASVYGVASRPSDRVALMYERSLARWPAFNRWLVPLSLFVFVASLVSAGAVLVATALRGLSARQFAGSVLITAAMVAPTAAYVVAVRT